ncbi:MAG: nicotinate phosphoribosyltransferase [Candidatus Omnitrophota bacterium]
MKPHPLLVDLYELTMAQAYFNYHRDTMATFDLFVRQLPAGRSFLLFAGLQDAIAYIKGLRFGAGDIAFLKTQRLFTPDFLRYLNNFKFRGDVWAMPEGTVFFAGEPVIRVTSSIIEGQILESCLLNTVNLATMIASKAARVVLAAGHCGVFDFSLRRTHGQDAAIKAARSSYLAGFSGTSNVRAAQLYGIPAVGTMAHSFVMSFKSELNSFRAYSNIFPGRSILLVDTYDTRIGLQNAIQIGKELKRRGYHLSGIRLDSGDIACLARLARRMLDREGLAYVKIFASGNLDEFKIARILSKSAPVDNFGVGTNMGASVDAPYLDVIYKISEVGNRRGKLLPTMKLSAGKVTFPGRKQVVRLCGKKGRYLKDVLVLEKERMRGKPLLKKVIRRGSLRYNPPSLKSVRRYVRTQLARFPVSLAHVRSRYSYPVAVSRTLKRLMLQLQSQLPEYSQS